MAAQNDAPQERGAPLRSPVVPSQGRGGPPRYTRLIVSSIQEELLQQESAEEPSSDDSIGRRLAVVVLGFLPLVLGLLRGHPLVQDEILVVVVGIVAAVVLGVSQHAGGPRPRGGIPT